MTKTFLLAASAAAALIATPAAARDGAFYVGIEGGGWFVNDIKAEAVDQTAIAGDHHVTGGLNTGYDADLIAGRDWGLFRTEAELSRKRAAFSDVDFGSGILMPPGISTGEKRAKGSLKVTTLAANLLGDFHLGGGWNVYAGPGIGWAWLDVHPMVYGISFFSSSDPAHSSKLNEEKKDGLFLQLVAGVRREVTPNLEVGAKYRFVRSKHESFDSGFFGDIRGRISAHSILASVIYSFGSVALPPPPPPPPPPPSPVAPATQTCPDGSVIDAASACPVPPPPPPPPPPAAGERG